MTTNANTSSGRSGWSTSPSFAIHAVPAAYMLAFPPHIYGMARMMLSSNYSYSNLTPRAQLSTLTPTLPASTVDSLWRARGAHLNALESFPIFASAMILGTYAGLPAADLNNSAAAYLGTRVLYTALYMTVRGEAASYLRSTAYFVNLGIPLWVLWKAGKKVAERDNSSDAGKKEL